MDDPNIQEESDTVLAAVNIISTEGVSDEDLEAATTAADEIMDYWNQDFEKGK